MRALTFDGALRFDRGRQNPTLALGEALIKTTLAGVCATDHEIVKGYMGFSGVIGHEFVGVVEEASDSLFVGKRVVGEINCSCNECDYCKKGLKTHCPNRSVLGIHNRDGVFADYFTLPEANLHIVPDSVADEVAVFTEPLAAAFQILKQVKISAKDSVAIMGDGKLGLLIAMAFASKGISCSVIGRHTERLNILAGIGIETTLAKDVSFYKKYDLVVDATGSPDGLNAALGLVRPRGTVVLKTTIAIKPAPADLNKIVIDEISLVGSRCGPFDVALNELEKKSVDPSSLVSRVVSIDNGCDVFESKKDSSLIKTIFKF